MSAISSDQCIILVKFEDVLMGEPKLVTIGCKETSPLFPYYLRQKIHTLKRVPPFQQKITKLSDESYSMKIRERNGKTLMPLTIHGHYFDKYIVHIDKQDTVMDVKFLLAPLVHHENKAQDIQLNFNTTRRLEDEEILYETNCVNNDEIVIQYWFEFYNPKNGESPIYQTVSKLADYNPLYPDVGTCVRSICASFKTGHKDNPKGETFGYREYLDKNDLSKRGDFKYMTFNDINRRVDNVSTALKDILKLEPGKSMLGLCSINRREWLLCDYACSVSSIVTVPLYPTLDANALEYITNHAKLNVIVTDSATLPDIIKLLDKCQPHLKHIILMDDELPDQLFIQSKEGFQLLNKYSNVVHLLSKLENDASQGIKNGKYIANDIIPKSDDVYTIMYTSGTTGNPKGVMLTHKNFMSVLNTALEFDLSDDEKFGLPAGQEAVHLSYLPLAHIMERMIDIMMSIRGTKIGFFRGDVTGLVEDMQVIKPPQFAGVPRIFQRIQNMVTTKMESSNFVVKKLYEYGYQSKLNAILKRKYNSKNNIWDKIIFNKINQQFGGNIRSVLSGSAPLSRETALFLKVTLAEQVLEGYGLTETTASGTGTHLFDLTFGHVGTPRSNIAIKLVDVPEMDYLTSDKPNPRGEIWMRGASIFKGYYKEPEKTNSVLMKDGWFKTGDIGEWRSNGRLAIIDRKKNIFKLSQGEYIRPEFIQNIYKLCGSVGNIFVYGDSYQNYLVAIVVPDFEALEQMNSKYAMSKKDELLKDNGTYDEIYKIVQGEMKIQEEKAKLNGFEKVKQFKLISEEFTNENGLLTISMKLKRNAAKKRFEKEIAQMYQIKSKL